MRSLSSIFESKVSAIEEKQYLQSVTIVQLHGILTAFETRKGGPLDIREASFKALKKGREKEDLKESGYVLEEDEVNFVKKLQHGSERFRGKLPFKCFASGRVGHYVAKCPHKDNHDKEKKSAKANRKQCVNRSNIIFMKIVMACLIVMKMNLNKILNYSWLMIMKILWMP